jgi:hypothetical protein
VYNSTTSATNPITLKEFKNSMLRAFTTERYNQQVGPIYLELVADPTLFRIKKYLFDDIPTKLLVAASGLPGIGSPAL